MAYYNGKYVNVTYTGDVSAETLREQVANAIVGTVSGVNAVRIDDVSPISHKIQVNLKRKNLLQNPFASIVVENGKTYTLSIKLKDGVTLSSDSVYRLDYFSSKGDWQNANLISDGVIVAASVEFTAGEDGNNGYYIESNGVTADMLYAQLEEGGAPTEYAPYVEDINAVRIMSYGKNLLKLNYNEYDPSKYEGEQKYGDAVKYEWRPPSSTSTRRMYYFNLPSNVNVRISVIRENTTNDFTLKIYRKENGTYVEKETIANGSLVYSKSISAGEYTEYALWTTSSTALKNMKDSETRVQIELGTIQTDYEEYKNPHNETVSIYPTTTIVANTAGVKITATYNQDTNKVIQELRNAIINSGGTV